MPCQNHSPELSIRDRAERVALLRSLGRLTCELEQTGIEVTAEAAAALLAHGDAVARAAAHSSWHPAFADREHLGGEELGAAALLAADWGEALARASEDDALGDAVMWTLLHGVHATACPNHADAAILETPPAVPDDRDGLCRGCRGVETARIFGVAADAEVVNGGTIQTISVGVGGGGVTR
jgi:hypothetical protein